MRHRACTSALLALLLAAGVCAAAAADTLLTVKGHADGVRIGDRTQEPRDTQVKIWLASDKMRRDEGTLTAIVRMDRKKLYLVNHTDRTYTAVDLPVDWTKLVPPRDQESFNRFLADNAMKAVVTPTPEEKTIHGWDAHRVDVELSSTHGMKLSTQMWVSKDLPFYAAYNQMSSALAALQPNSAEWSKKLGQMAGFPVYQETTVAFGGTSFKSREELVSADTKDAPPGTYDVPQGFTATPFDPYAGPH